MKRLFTYLAGFSFLAITTVSCSKEGQEEMRQQTYAPEVIQAAVSGAQTYVLDLGLGSTARIQKQPSYAAQSELATARDGSTSYKYTAAKGYTGTDEVTLVQSTTYTVQSGGCYGNNSNGSTRTTSKTIVVKFTVAN